MVLLETYYDDNRTKMKTKMRVRSEKRVVVNHPP